MATFAFLHPILLVLCITETGSAPRCECCEKLNSEPMINLTSAAEGDYYSLRRVVKNLQRDGVPEKRLAAALCEMLSSADPQVRRKAAASLGELDVEATDAIEALVKLFDDVDERVRRAAVRSVGSIDGRRMLDQIGRLLLSDESASVRATAAFALGITSTSNSVPFLVAALQDEDADVRSAAVRSLDRLGKLAGESVPSLVKLLSDQSYRQQYISNDLSFSVPIRHDVLEALAAIGPAAAITVPYLEGITRREEAMDPGTHMRASFALMKITGDSSTALSTLRKYLGHEAAHVRRDVLILIEDLGSNARPIASEVAHCLKDSDSLVRTSAVTAMAAIAAPDDRLFQLINETAQDPDPIVAGAAILSLARTLNNPGDDFLNVAFDVNLRHRLDPLDYYLRAEVGEAMRVAVGPEKAIHYLQSRFRHGTGDEKIEALKLISRLDLASGYELCVLRDLANTSIGSTDDYMRRRIEELSLKRRMFLGITSPQERVGTGKQNEGKKDGNRDGEK
jgi:HEAT repeat protein